MNERLFDSQKYLEGVTTKWAHLVDDKKPQIKGILAHMYEMQEQDAVMAKAYMETTDQSTSTLPITVFPFTQAIPIIDQVFPNLVAMQIAQVKPMVSPTQRIYYRTYQFSTGPTAFTHTGTTASLAELQQVKRARTNLTYVDMSAESLKLGAQYSWELRRDAMRAGNLDFEAEQMAAIRDELTGELDYIVLTDHFNGATAGNVNWSQIIGSGHTTEEWQRTLGNAIVEANNLVFAKMQTNCNYIVGDANAVGELEKMSQFRLDDGAAADVFSAGTVRVGTFANKYAVFKTTVAPANKLLLGVKGAAYLYCPYVPLELTERVYDADLDQYIQNVRTSFGRKLIRGDALSTITITA